MLCIVTGSEFARNYKFSDTFAVPLCDKANVKLLSRLMEDKEHEALTERIKKEEAVGNLIDKGLNSILQISGVVLPEDVDQMILRARSDAKVTRLLLRRGIIAARHLSEMIEEFNKTGKLT